MHTAIETKGYFKAVNDTKMGIDEQEAAVRLVSDDPAGGDIMQGTGGVRKAWPVAARASQAATGSSGISGAMISRRSC